jgi:hypothetical protein
VAAAIRLDRTPSPTPAPSRHPTLGRHPVASAKFRAGAAAAPGILVGRPDGTITRFLVGRLERHPMAALPTSRIWTKANRPLLRLITCAGSFDHATGHYRDNLILYASPTGS